VADFIVGLTDTPIDSGHPPADYTLCGNYSRQVSAGTIAIACQPTVVSGQFLFIRRIGAESTVLKLSEVQVYSGSTLHVFS